MRLRLHRVEYTQICRCASSVVEMGIWFYGLWVPPELGLDLKVQACHTDLPRPS